MTDVVLTGVSSKNREDRRGEAGGALVPESVYSLAAGQKVDIGLQLWLLIRQHQSFRTLFEDFVHEAVSSGDR